jgi:hypothetical protein
MKDGFDGNLEERYNKMKHWRHTNLLRIFRFSRRLDGYVCYEMEILDGCRTLTEALTTTDNTLTRKDKNRIALAIVSVLRFLVKNNVDIGRFDTDSILLDAENIPRLSWLRLSTARDVSLNPEQAAYRLPLDWNEDLEVEVLWAFGTLVYRMFASSQEWSSATQTRNTFAFINKILLGYRLMRPAEIPDSIWKLVSECWQVSSDLSLLDLQATLANIMGEPLFTNDSRPLPQLPEAGENPGSPAAISGQRQSGGRRAASRRRERTDATGECCLLL